MDTIQVGYFHQVLLTTCHAGVTLSLVRLRAHRWCYSQLHHVATAVKCTEAEMRWMRRLFYFFEYRILTCLTSLTNVEACACHYCVAGCAILVALGVAATSYIRVMSSKDW
jgi:hypothetical protein